jgi:hypothetical protein
MPEWIRFSHYHSRKGVGYSIDYKLSRGQSFFQTLHACSGGCICLMYPLARALFPSGKATLNNSADVKQALDFTVSG